MNYNKGSHTVYDIRFHFVWTTERQLRILKGPVAERTRALLLQECRSSQIKVLGGGVGENYVHMILSCPPTLAPESIIQKLKEKTSRALSMEFDSVRELTEGQPVWEESYFCASVGDTDADEAEVKQYIEHYHEDGEPLNLTDEDE